MATTLIAKMQEYDPGAEPDWRYQRILEILHRVPQPGRCSKYDDTYVRQAKSFIQSYRQDQTPHERRKLMMDCPELYYAYLIHERAGHGTPADLNIALLIQARIVAGQYDEDIAKSCGTHPSVIDWYSRIFFDVRPRLNQRDWITTRVLVPALVRSPVTDDEDEDDNGPEIFSRNFLDGSLKYFGYFGGGEVIDTILGGQRREVAENATDDFLDSFFKRQLKVKTIQAISRLPVNRYNIGNLLETYMEIVKLEKASGASADEATYNGAMGDLLRQVNFCVGDDGKKRVQGTPMADYYERDFDLSHAEQQKLLGGVKLNLPEEDMQNPLLTRSSTLVKEVLADVKTTTND